MYRVLLKTAFVEALQKSFAADYVSEDFQQVKVSMEYPIDRQSYPSIWVNYADNAPLRIASIFHREYDQIAGQAAGQNPDSQDFHWQEYTRWVFSGDITLTFVALTSLERDNLYDQFIRVYAFAPVEQAQVVFRDIIDNNDLIRINANFDELQPGADSAAPGTPWGSDVEVIYEVSASFSVIGEFISDQTLSVLVPLSEIDVDGQNSDNPSTPPPLRIRYVGDQGQ